VIPWLFIKDAQDISQQRNKLFFIQFTTRAKSTQFAIKKKAEGVKEAKNLK
jgi:hypothetical protein